MSLKSLLFIIFFLIALISSLTLVFRTTVFFGRASSGSNLTSTTVFSPSNSYLFASPLQAKADGQETIRLTVFLLDSRGLGLANQKVEIVRSQIVNVLDIQPVTDDTGKAVFDLSSPTPGQYPVSAISNNQEISQKLKIVFY